jgi:hypothetical protein
VTVPWSGVGVVFRDFGGSSELQYASELASLLKLPLSVYVEHPVHDPFCISANAAEVKQRVVSSVSGLAPVEVDYRPVTGDSRQYDFPDGQVVVGNEIAHIRRDVSVLAPFDEAKPFGRGPGPVLIPLGNGESGIWALTYGLQLVQQLGSEVIFWHTTWRNPSVADADPAKHMSEKASANLREADYLARALRVPYRTIVETTDGVVEGLVRRALRERCALIVMTRGLATGMGRYGDTLLDRASPVPLLMIGRRELR